MTSALAYLDPGQVGLGTRPRDKLELRLPGTI
jgi:hypothetical protein